MLQFLLKNPTSFSLEDFHHVQTSFLLLLAPQVVFLFFYLQQDCMPAFFYKNEFLCPNFSKILFTSPTSLKASDDKNLLQIKFSISIASRISKFLSTD